MDERSARQARAAARSATVVLRKGRLGDVEYDFSPVRGVDAISLVTRLTRECWAIRGDAIDPLDRETIPVHFVPRADRGG